MFVKIKFLTIGRLLLQALFVVATVAAFPVPLQGEAENKVTSGASLKSTQPLVRKISDTHYQIGLITLNKETREISFPASTNITDPYTAIEYLLVHAQGEKVHEALLVTEADPTHLNIAFKLLNYKESRELFYQRGPDGNYSGDRYDEPEATRKAARFSIHVTQKKKTTPVTDWVRNRSTGASMPMTPWIYNGSYIYKQQFNAKLTGSIFTIQPDPGAIANFPGIGREDDTLWLPAADTPHEGSKVTVTLKPWKG